MRRARLKAIENILKTGHFPKGFWTQVCVKTPGMDSDASIGEFSDTWSGVRDHFFGTVKVSHIYFFSDKFSSARFQILCLDFLYTLFRKRSRKK